MHRLIFIPLLFFCILLGSCQQTQVKSNQLTPVDSNSSPKTVEDSAKTIIERANKNIKDSGKHVEEAEKSQPD